MAGEFAPAVGGNFAVLGVEAHDDVAAECAASVLEEARVLDRSGADDHVAQAAVDVFFDGVEVPDTATELHRNVVTDRLEDGADGRVVLRLARKRTVQIHQMQAACALRDPFEGHRGGVFAEGGGLVHVALFEANAVAVFQVNCRNEKHGAGARFISG